MREPLGLLASVSVLLAVCVAVPSGAVAPRVAIRVVPGAVEDGLAIGMFRELVAVWRRCGVEVLFSAGGLEPAPVTTVSLIVAPGWPPADAAGGLGWIHFVSDPAQTPAPVLMVSLAATRALVDAADYRGMPVAQRPLALRRELTARALGRAAAHELGHYLLTSREHTPRGLMRARFSSDDLVSDESAAFTLEASARLTVLARLRGPGFFQRATVPR